MDAENKPRKYPYCKEEIKPEAIGVNTAARQHHPKKTRTAESAPIAKRPSNRMQPSVSSGVLRSDQLLVTAAAALIRKPLKERRSLFNSCIRSATRHPL